MVFLNVTKGLNKIGRLGENNHRTFRFGETCEALAMYPDASVAVLHRRPGDAAAYPVAPGFVQIVDGAVCWTVMSGDLARKGRGKVEVVILDGTTVAKSYIYDTCIEEALDGSGTPPEPMATYLAQIIAAGEHAPKVINGTWWAWSTSAQAYADTEVSAQGEDGRGIASTTLLENYCLRITFTDGTSVDVGPIRGAPGQDYVITSEDYDAIAAEVATRTAIQGKVDAAEAAANEARNWADGKNRDGTVNPLYNENNGKFFALLCLAATGHYPRIGQNGNWEIWDVQNETWTDTGVSATGADGVSPTVTVTPITGGNRITITDGVGSHSFDVMDGQPGGVQDVQVNGVSVLSGGVANVPLATNNGATGAVKLGSNTNGLEVDNGILKVLYANINQIKDPVSNIRRPITPYYQHSSVFYGLAKAAGADMANVSGATVGVYHEAQKSAIHEMLNGSVAVTGTTPSITALPGVEYVCGEVATLDITLPASGCIDVTFVSGSTPTTLTVTPPTGVTVSWPDGFDPTNLDANTTYEINIKNGLAVVGKWA